VKKYITEREGQIDFFDNFRIDYKKMPILIDNTDGVYNGCLLEFKLEISNLNKTLSQAIKYLSHMRIKGESVPAKILLISLNNAICYVYDSKDYYEDIHKIYIGAASKNNDNFLAKEYKEILEYSNDKDAVRLTHILKDEKEIYEKYIPIELNEDCIVGWATRFYSDFPKATKGDFLGSNDGLVPIVGEIREPIHFKHLIKPYTKPTNEKFKYLMDVLNDRLRKKSLGAYYTPIPYCEKAAELLRIAINNVPQGNDYIILDRCAGTGNLESVLTDEELSHCILSTYEYYEYKVLLERLGDKVRAIIPPTENNVEYSCGCIMNANALEKQYIENEIIKEYIEDEKCTIILFENPPYQDSSAITYVDNNGERALTERKETYVASEFLKDIDNLNEKRSSFREISNLFIWSGFKYYMRQPSDCYVLFSPIKYWKSILLVNKKMIKGFLFNRIYFHAKSASAISCILWQNVDEKLEKLNLDIIDIIGDNTKKIGDSTIKKVYKNFLDLYDKRKFDDDVLTTVVCGRDGYPDRTHKIDGNPYYNDNIIAYVRTINYSLDNMNHILTTQMYFGARGYYLRKDNYERKLPLFVAKLFPEENWYEKDIYYNSSDGGTKFENDNEFLKQCLIYTCLSTENKCISFLGNDGRKYINNLCFDYNTQASKDLKKYKLNKKEEELLNIWNSILEKAKTTIEYKNLDCEFKLGIHQINNQINTFYFIENEFGEKTKIYNYPDLNGNLNLLKVKLKEYFDESLRNKLFLYELLK